jgi:NADP-dependent 3-hydroxy acid dehydrogenase YdfG
MAWKLFKKTDRGMTDRSLILQQQIEEYQQLDRDRRVKIAALRERIDMLKAENQQLHDIAIDLDALATDLDIANRKMADRFMQAYIQASGAKQTCEKSAGFSRIHKPVQEQILEHIRKCVDECLGGMYQ